LHGSELLAKRLVFCPQLSSIAYTFPKEIRVLRKVAYSGNVGEK